METLYAVVYRWNVVKSRQGTDYYPEYFSYRGQILTGTREELEATHLGKTHDVVELKTIKLSNRGVLFDKDEVLPEWNSFVVKSPVRNHYPKRKPKRS